VTPEELLCATPQPVGPGATSTGRRRLSVFRVVAAIGVLVVVVAGLVLVVRGGTTPAAAAGTHGFAPYVDVTATPTYAFEGAGESGPTDAILAFVVSSERDACDPSWGGAYSLDEAAEQLDLDRRVARLGQLGRRVTVSFGGAANSELAIACTDVDDLAAAYESVVDRYSIDTIDLDIEGAEASAPDVVQRRARAVAAVVAARRAAGRHLDVWLTLPVATTGLTAEGLEILRATLDGGVDPAGVNAMVMDYGVPFEPGATMGDRAESALTAMQTQLRDTYAAAGRSLSEDQAWQRVGATAMIGQNDVLGEVFDLDDAHQLLGFARSRHLRQLSMWSANRDQDCGPNYPDVTVVSDQCSGVAQTAGGFADVLDRFGRGGSRSDPAAPSTTAPVTASPASASADAEETDDPARSPYQIWSADQAYPAKTKVVWHRNVYVAKWYSMGELPDAPVADAHLTPWSLVGPVLPGEHPPVTPTLAPGTYPRWRADRIYEGGEKVLRRGIGYRAKWWTQGDPPDAAVSSPYDSPWLQLSG
jgi:chitinase